MTIIGARKRIKYYFLQKYHSKSIQSKKYFGMEEKLKQKRFNDVFLIYIKILNNYQEFIEVDI